MKNNIEAIESLSDELEVLNGNEQWEGLTDIINQQQLIITDISAEINHNGSNEEQRLLLVASIKRALCLQKTLIKKAHWNKEKAAKAVAELSNRKKMHSAYNEQ